MTRILIVEDEDRLAAFLDKGLRASGFSTAVARDGQTATSLARQGEFDLMLLDLGLPDVDGLEVLREIRAGGSEFPAIVLTAHDELVDKVVGLDSGADDYVTKPFSFEELLARIRVRLRGEGTASSTVLRSDGITLDLRTRSAHLHGRTVELTAREFTMLETFMRHPGQVLSRDQLLSLVWGYDFEPGSNVVDVYIGYLRKKLGEQAIHTVRGMGYVLQREGSPGGANDRVRRPPRGGTGSLGGRPSD
jgi:DNA-binding response OmpR family regulator